MKIFLILYLMSVIMSLNISSWWWMWLTFEIMNWLLMLMMNSKYLMLFLILQSLFSMFIVFGIVLMKKVVTLVLFAKMGIPPFHYWVINNQTSWSLKSFLLFISIHKWAPSIILLNFFSYIWISVIFMFISFILFYFISGLKMLIFGISINDMGWLMFSWLVSLKMFLFYLTINSIIFIMFLKCKDLSNLDFQLLLLFLLNMPPFISFLVKWMVLSYLFVMAKFLSLLAAWFMLILVWYWLSVKLLNHKIFIMKLKKFLLVFLTSFFLWF